MINAVTQNGNEHISGIKRKLNDPEKDTIKAEFMALNGVFEDAKKSCTALLPQMGTEITVWQVTGFVSYLHREIAASRLQVLDMDAYTKFLENHRRLWALYDSQKYQNLRAKLFKEVIMSLPIAKTKYCCGGGNAIMVEPLWPMQRRDKRFYMALFQCKVCNEYTLRGENQEKEWNTYVEILNEKYAKELIEKKKQRTKR